MWVSVEDLLGKVELHVVAEFFNSECPCVLTKYKKYREYFLNLAEILKGKCPTVLCRRAYEWRRSSDLYMACPLRTGSL